MFRLDVCGPARTGLLSLAAALALGAAVPAVATAQAPGYAYYNTCDPRGSGDVCWLTYSYSTPRALSKLLTQTQYYRDQVCSKARFQTTTGGVVDGSSCSAGGAADHEAYFVNPGSPKKGYGYWAGNGGGIWVRVNGI